MLNWYEQSYMTDVGCMTHSILGPLYHRGSVGASQGGLMVKFSVHPVSEVTVNRRSQGDSFQDLEYEDSRT